MKKMMILICVCGLLISWTEPCAAKGPPNHICFRRIDADHDGKVTMEEFAVHFGEDPKKFKAADSDGDGLLTHDEYHDFLGHGAAEK